MSKTVQTNIQKNKDRQPASQTPVPLQAEELEQVVAPKLSTNHNQNVLAAEELEAVIAPRLASNHNETVLG